MKVGTDAVILGCSVPVEKRMRILDIGTGSGIIALMLAQRNKNAVIDGIEIDERAAMQAKENFTNSPFSAQLTSHCICAKKFAETKIIKNYNIGDTELMPYDLIVSNPPFFHANASSDIDSRSIARSVSRLTHIELATIAYKLLESDGLFYCILPLQEGVKFLNKILDIDLINIEQQMDKIKIVANCLKWSLDELIIIKPNQKKKANRLIIGLKKVDLKKIDISIIDNQHEYDVSPTFLTIRNNDNSYTAEMKVLTSQFMLKH
ncbi:tRNA1(Val) (adenine(37)-N6)-methyltransferase [Thorsellia anophelis]|nr:methyltransferase [Thorsellia anophelis]